MLHRHVAATSALVVSTWMTAACVDFPDVSDSADESIIATAHDRSVDFASFTTFAISSSVTVAQVADDGMVTPGSLAQADSDAIISKVASSMTARGFVQTSADQSPDLGVGVSTVQGSVSGAITGGYWGGYYSAYWGYPGWGYYYPYAYSYSYRTGSLIIDIVDLKRARQAGFTPGLDAGAAGMGSLSIVWAAIAYRALIGGAPNLTEVQNAIDQAFAQSPYLRR